MKMERDNTKGKTKVSKSPNTENTAVEVEDTWMRGKLLHLNQLRHLDEQLLRFQLRRDSLKDQKQDLSLKFSRLKEDIRDIHQYLLHAPDRCQQEQEQVLGWLEQQESEEKQASEAHELQLSLERQELQRNVDTVTSEIDQQASQLEELTLQLEELTLQLEELNQQVKEEHLDALQEQHEADVQQLELEHKRLLEEEQFKLNMAIKVMVTDVVQEHRIGHKERTLRLRFLLSEAQRQRALLDQLKKDLKELCQEERTDKALLCSVTQTVSYLHKKAEIQTRRAQKLRDEVKVSASASQSLQDNLEVCRQKLASVSKQQCQHSTTVAYLVTQLEDARRRRRMLEKVMKTAVAKLTTILKDSRKGSDTKLKMQKVLKVLENARPQEGESTDLGPETTDAEAARAQTQNLDLDSLFLLARYRPGDITFVPRRTWIPTTHSACAHTSWTRPPPNRNFCHRRTAAEEASTPAEADQASYHGSEGFRHFLCKFLEQ